MSEELFCVRASLFLVQLARTLSLLSVLLKHTYPKSRRNTGLNLESQASCILVGWSENEKNLELNVLPCITATQIFVVLHCNDIVPV